jgi:hypothetical protein
LLLFQLSLLFHDETNTVHPLFAKAERLSCEIIGAAIEVHRIMGPASSSLTGFQGLCCPEQTSLEQKETKVTKGASRGLGGGQTVEPSINSTSVESMPSFGRSALAIAWINKTSWPNL